METIFGPAGLLAATLPDYETRPGQEKMAHAIARSLDGRAAPGGGVHGMCGYYAARSAIRRLGKLARR